jgi:hypothetical protein
MVELDLDLICETSHGILYLQAQLPSVLRIYRDTLTADMKNAIKNAVAELLPVLVARPELEFTPGERTVDADGEKFIT